MSRDIIRILKSEVVGDVDGTGCDHGGGGYSASEPSAVLAGG